MVKDWDKIRKELTEEIQRDAYEGNIDNYFAFYRCNNCKVIIPKMKEGLIHKKPSCVCNEPKLERISYEDIWRKE